MTYLEEWSNVDQAYTGSLSGAIESLRASTLRLPVIDGARVQGFSLPIFFLLYYSFPSWPKDVRSMSN